MLCIHNTQTDPYFNLAAEEYLLKNFKENIFMLWQNEPSIVIGKHQDVWAEVNLKFVQDQQTRKQVSQTGVMPTILYHFTEMPCQFPEPLLEQKA